MILGPLPPLPLPRFRLRQNVVISLVAIQKNYFEAAATTFRFRFQNPGFNPLWTEMMMLAKQSYRNQRSVRVHRSNFFSFTLDIRFWIVIEWSIFQRHCFCPLLLEHFVRQTFWLLIPKIRKGNAGFFSVEHKNAFSRALTFQSGSHVSLNVLLVFMSFSCPFNFLFVRPLKVAFYRRQNGFTSSRVNVPRQCVATWSFWWYGYSFYYLLTRLCRVSAHTISKWHIHFFSRLLGYDHIYCTSTDTQ